MNEREGIAEADRDADSGSNSYEWGMTGVGGGFNWDQMLLHNNTGFSAAYEVSWGRDEVEGLAFGQ